jgi:hypothetical protein
MENMQSVTTWKKGNEQKKKKKAAKQNPLSIWK